MFVWKIWYADISFCMYTRIGYIRFRAHFKNFPHGISAWFNLLDPSFIRKRHRPCSEGAGLRPIGQQNVQSASDLESDILPIMNPFNEFSNGRSSQYRCKLSRYKPHISPDSETSGPGKATSSGCCTKPTIKLPLTCGAACLQRMTAGWMDSAFALRLN